MSEETATATTEQKAASMKQRKKERVEDATFSMNFWEDERLARKFMKENMLFIAQKAGNDGIKAHFSNTKDNGEGLSVMEVQFADTRVEERNGQKKKTIVEFTGNNYIRVTYNPNRKFPKSSKEGGEKKKAALPSFVKFSSLLEENQ